MVHTLQTTTSKPALTVAAVLKHRNVIGPLCYSARCLHPNVFDIRFSHTYAFFDILLLHLLLHTVGQHQNVEILSTIYYFFAYTKQQN